MKKVLFINYGGIGDEILFLPCISGFKRLYPDSKVTLCLEQRAAGIKNLTCLIDDIITVDIKARGFKKYFNVLRFIVSVWFKGYDIVISSGKSPFVAIILFLTGIKTKIGYKTKTSGLLSHSVILNENSYAAKMYFDLIKPLKDIDFHPPEINYAKNFKPPYEEDFILIHPGVSMMSVQKNILKCPRPAFWIELINNLLKSNRKVVLAGGPDDEAVITEIINAVNRNQNFCSMYKKTKNLLELAALIKKSKTFICCDSAPMHIASAFNKNIIALFGPTNELKLLPDKKNIHVVKKNINCRPCLWHARHASCSNPVCIDFNSADVLELIK